MTPLEWVFSAGLLIWLLAMFIWEYRVSRIPGLPWFLIPLGIILLFRSLDGHWQLSLIALVALLLSERRHLQSRLLSIVALIAAATLLFLLLPWSVLTVDEGIVCICLFWFAWERKIITSQAALSLFICILFFMGIGFTVVYIAVGSIFLLATRMVSRKADASLRLWNSAYAPILISFLLVLIDRVFFHLLG